MPSILRRSPDADKIYAEYVGYYEDVNKKIEIIDQLPPDIWSRKNVQDDRASILAEQAELGSVYQIDYAKDSATLETFRSDCTPILTRVTAAFNDAIGGGTIQQKIQLIYMDAQGISGQITTNIGQDRDKLDCIANLQATIASLQVKINAMAPGPDREKAQADLGIAQGSLEDLEKAIAAAQEDFAPIVAESDAITKAGGILNQLKELAAKSDATEGDLDQAKALMVAIQKAQGDLQVFDKTNMGNIGDKVAIVRKNIQAVQADIQPGPTPGTVEHGCWYIDWTSRDYPIPQGVNNVKIFVGRLNIVGGKPTVDGFGNMDTEKLKAYVEACHNHEPPIAVQISIGGGGGSYDNCWDLLTSENVGDFAQGLADFCHDNHIDGIDFDYEEFKSPEQEALVGRLIKEFKAKDPKFETSICANAGFSTWQSHVKNILDAAIDPTTGKCGVDRVHFMTYYNDIEQEKAWLAEWWTWLKTEYGFKAWQIGVGIDDFDAHAYDIAEMSKYAGSQGFSTSYWAWNPTTQANSDASTLKIANSYNPVSKKETASTLSKASLPIVEAIPVTMNERIPPPGGI